MSHHIPLKSLNLGTVGVMNRSITNLDRTDRLSKFIVIKRVVLGLFS